MEEEIQQTYQISQSGPMNTSDEMTEEVIIPKITPIYDPLLIQHPIFSFSSDPVFSFLTQSIKSLIQQTPDTTLFPTYQRQWFNLLFQNTFPHSDLNTLKEEFLRLGLSFDTVCGKFIESNGIYFRCLDCDKFKDTSSTMYALLCSQCFENSNHENHRVLMIKMDPETSATCDCGDHTAFDSDGFCQDHQPQHYCPQETLNKFPQTFLKQYSSVITNAFYGAISMFELSFTAGEHIKEGLSALAQLTLEGILLFCSICSEKVNEAFLIAIGEVLKSTFQSQSMQVWHDCTDLTASKGAGKVFPESPHKCTCTIAGSLLRIANFPEQEIQLKLNKLFVECAKEQQFKVFLVKEFTKYMHFLYSETYAHDDFEDHTNSKLLNMKVQLFGSEEFRKEALNSGFFSNFMGVLKKTINLAYQANYEVYHIVSDIRSSLVSFLNDQNQTSKTLLQGTGLMSQVLEILMNFQVKFIYEGQIRTGLHEHQVNYKSINRGLMIEKVLCQMVEQGLKQISTFPCQDKTALMNKFTKEWLSCFQTSKSILNEELKKGIVSFHPSLERILFSMVKLLAHDHSEPSLLHGLQHLFPADIDSAKLAEQIMQGCVRSLGMVRNLHLAHNLNGGSVWQVYYFAHNLFFEVDVLTSQAMIAMMNPEGLFENLIDNYFSYDAELRQFFKTPESLKSSDPLLKQRLASIEDFLHFLVFLMNDQTCELNFKISKNSNWSSEETQLSHQNHHVIEKVLVNLLAGHSWIGVPQLKETMKNVLFQHSDIDTILQKVSVFDEKTKKVRVKEEYQSQFDPYIFFRDPALQNEINHNVSGGPLGQKTDFVSGKFEQHLPEHLKKVQSKLFQSNLPHFLASFLQNLEKHTELLVRPVLKLILMDLQAVQEQFKKAECQMMKARLQENYFTQSFKGQLTKLQEDEGFKDCKSCIENIQKSIQALSSSPESEMNEETSPGTGKEDQAALKKKLAQERMLKMKQDFLNKQKNFMKKNSDSMPEQSQVDVETQAKEASADVEQEEELICQFCLDKINKEATSYGVPVYISFTNNFGENGKINEENSWPLMSSCNHHYHQKCFKSHFESSRKNTDMAKLFANGFEFCCTFCNSLCNNFITEGSPKKGSKIETEDENHLKEETVSPHFFIDTLGALQEDLKKKLRRQDSGAMEEEHQGELDELFKQGFIYFLESFSQSEKESSLAKRSKLYQLFLKEYRNYLKRSQKNSGEKKTTSFMQRVFGDSQDTMKEETIERVLGCNAEGLLSALSFEVLQSGEKGFVQQQKILEEYLAFKTVQAAMSLNGFESIQLDGLYSLLQDEEEFRMGILEQLELPLQKLVLASFVSRKESVNDKIFKTLLSSDYDIDCYLDELIKSANFGESLDEVIKTALEELSKSSFAEFFNQAFAMKKPESFFQQPVEHKMIHQVVKLPENYLQFISAYTKKKCSSCKNFSISRALCLICGDVLCLAACPSHPQKRGNLNNHAKEHHMGNSIFLEMQRFNKIVVGCSKNAIYAGKSVYRDQLGHSIQSMISDPRGLLYSLEFDKFTLSEDFIKETREVIEQNSMQREIYKITKTSGYYYAEGSF